MSYSLFKAELFSQGHYLHDTFPLIIQPELPTFRILSFVIIIHAYLLIFPTNLTVIYWQEHVFLSFFSSPAGVMIQQPAW